VEVRASKVRFSRCPLLYTHIQMMGCHKLRLELLRRAAVRHRLDVPFASRNPCLRRRALAEATRTHRCRRAHAFSEVYFSCETDRQIFICAQSFAAGRCTIRPSLESWMPTPSVKGWSVRRAQVVNFVAVNVRVCQFEPYFRWIFTAYPLKATTVIEAL